MNIADAPLAHRGRLGPSGLRAAWARLEESRRTWYHAVGIGIGAFVISRLIVLAGVYSRAAQDVSERRARLLPVPESMRLTIQNIFLQWDGRWYRMIASNGYPRTLDDPITLRGDSATVAFFPVYPALAWAFDHVVPGGVDEALLAVNLLVSVAAVILVGVLARDVYGVDVATRAMVLFSLFPGSVAMSWSYAEPSLVVFAAATLILVRRHRWALAGLTAAVGTATDPRAVALIAASAVAALLAIHRHRQWRSLIAVVLAPLGLVGYHVFLRWWTGEWGAWMRAQREGWNEGWSWGETAVRFAWRFLENPLGASFGPTYMHTFVAIVALAVGIFCSARARLPLEMWAYVAVVAFLMLAPSTVTARPRFVFAAFPLVLGVAACWRRQERLASDALVVLSAGSLAAFTVLYASQSAIP